MAAQAHAHGLRIVGATHHPFVDSDYFHPGPLTRRRRQQVDARPKCAGPFRCGGRLRSPAARPGPPDRLSPALIWATTCILLSPAIAPWPRPCRWRSVGREAAASPPRCAQPDWPSPEPGRREPRPPQLAITFDDLPGPCRLLPGETRLTVARTIIAALKAASARRTLYGFVNGVHIQDDADLAAVLARPGGPAFHSATTAGRTLNLERLSASPPFEADVLKNEAVFAGPGRRRRLALAALSLPRRRQRPRRTAPEVRLLRGRGAAIASPT